MLNRLRTTSTQSLTSTASKTSTSTTTESSTTSNTASSTASNTSTATSTSSTTATPTPSITPTSTSTETPTPSNTSTATSSSTNTATSTTTASPTPPITLTSSTTSTSTATTTPNPSQAAFQRTVTGIQKINTITLCASPATSPYLAVLDNENYVVSCFNHSSDFTLSIRLLNKENEIIRAFTLDEVFDYSPSSAHALTNGEFLITATRKNDKPSRFLLNHYNVTGTLLQSIPLNSTNPSVVYYSALSPYYLQNSHRLITVVADNGVLYIAYNLDDVLTGTNTQLTYNATVPTGGNADRVTVSELSDGNYVIVNLVHPRVGQRPTIQAHCYNGFTDERIGFFVSESEIAQNPVNVLALEDYFVISYFRDWDFVVRNRYLLANNCTLIANIAQEIDSVAAIPDNNNQFIAFNDIAVKNIYNRIAYLFTENSTPLNTFTLETDYTDRGIPKAILLSNNLILFARVNQCTSNWWHVDSNCQVTGEYYQVLFLESSSTTATYTFTTSNTPSITITPSATSTITTTATETSTSTSSTTNTRTSTSTATSTNTATVTPSITSSTTSTLTGTSTSTSTQTATSTTTANPTPSITPTSSMTTTGTSTATGTTTTTSSTTSTATFSPTSSTTSTQSLTPTASVTSTSTKTVTPSTTNTKTSTSTATSTNTATVTPSITSSTTSTLTGTSTSTGTQTAISSLTNTGTSTATSSRTATSTPAIATASPSTPPIQPIQLLEHVENKPEYEQIGDLVLVAQFLEIKGIPAGQLIDAAEVSIVENFIELEDVLNVVTQSGITENYLPEQGKLYLSGSSYVDKYQGVLHTVSYQNRADNPTLLNRKIAFRVYYNASWSAALIREIDFSTLRAQANNTKSSQNDWLRDVGFTIISLIATILIKFIKYKYNEWEWKNYKIANEIRCGLKFNFGFLNSPNHGLGQLFIHNINSFLAEYYPEINFNKLISDGGGWGTEQDVTVNDRNIYIEKFTKVICAAIIKANEDDASFNWQVKGMLFEMLPRYCLSEQYHYDQSIILSHQESIFSITKDKLITRSRCYLEMNHVNSSDTDDIHSALENNNYSNIDKNIAIKKIMIWSGKSNALISLKKDINRKFKRSWLRDSCLFRRNNQSQEIELVQVTNNP